MTRNDAVTRYALILFVAICLAFAPPVSGQQEPEPSDIGGSVTKQKPAEDRIAEERALQGALEHVAQGNVFLKKAIELANRREFHGAMLQNALREYDLAIGQSPKLFEAWFNQGITHIWLKRSSGNMRDVYSAVNAFKEAAHLDPKSPAPHLAIGQTYFHIVVTAYAGGSHNSDYQQGRKLALKSLEEVTKRFPSTKEAQIAQQQIGDVKYHESTNIIQQRRRPRTYAPIISYSKVSPSAYTERLKSGVGTVPAVTLFEDTLDIGPASYVFENSYVIKSQSGHKLHDGWTRLAAEVTNTRQFGQFFKTLPFTYYYRGTRKTREVQLPFARSLSMNKTVVLADEEHLHVVLDFSDYRANSSGYYDSLTVHVVGKQR